MIRKKIPREIKPLTEFLENNESFKKASLGVHNSKNTVIDRFWKSVHDAAFNEQKADKHVKLLESQKNRPKK